jgi:hypothetical protein
MILEDSASDILEDSVYMFCEEIAIAGLCTAVDAWKITS